MDEQLTQGGADVAAISASGLAASLWGMTGVLVLLGQAIYRLTPIALEPLERNALTATQSLIYAAWVAFNAYAEGYRAFHKMWSPRVAARALHLTRRPSWLHALLAPVFCMALIHATRRRLVVSWVMVVTIVCVVIAVRQLAQPWRGIIDGGVVIGLAWGAVATLYFYVRGLSGYPVAGSADLPPAGAEP